MPRFAPPLLIYSICFTLSHGVPGIIPLLPTFQKEFSLSVIEVNNCLAYFSYTALIATPILGYLYNKLSKRLFINLTNIIYFCGLIGICFCTDYSVLLFFRIVQGIGSAGLTLLMTILPPEYYESMERAKIMGKSHGIMALGLFFNPLVSGFLALYSWKLSVLALALPTLLTLFILSQTDLKQKYDIPKKAFRFSQIKEVLRRPYIPNLFIALFIIAGTDLSVPSLFSLFSAESFGYSSSTIGMIYAFGNIGMFAGASWLLTKLLPIKPFPVIIFAFYCVNGFLLLFFTQLSMPVYFAGFFSYYCLSGVIQPFLNYCVSNTIPPSLLTIGLTVSMTCFRAGQGFGTMGFAVIKDLFSYETAFAAIAAGYLFVLIISIPVMKKQGKLS